MNQGAVRLQRKRKSRSFSSGPSTRPHGRLNIETTQGRPKDGGSAPKVAAFEWFGSPEMEEEYGKSMNMSSFLAKNLKLSSSLIRRKMWNRCSIHFNTFWVAVGDDGNAPKFKAGLLTPYLSLFTIPNGWESSRRVSHSSVPSCSGGVWVVALTQPGFPLTAADPWPKTD